MNWPEAFVYSIGIICCSGAVIAYFYFLTKV